jgi:drug/metabolite transporter (DMT)-like permease
MTRATAQLLLASMTWGIGYPCAVRVLEVVPPERFAGLRFVAGGMVLLGIVLVRRRSRPRGTQLAREAALGLLAFGLYQLLWIEGILRVGPGVASILISTSPLFGVAIAWTRGSPIRARAWAGLAAGLLGVWLVAGRPGMGAASTSTLGMLLCLGASAVWAVFVELQRRFSSDEPVRATAVGMLAGALLLLAIPASTVPGSIGAAHIASFAFIAGVGAFAFVWWSRGVTAIGVARAMPFMYLIPVFAMLASAVLIGEPLVPMRILGAAFVLIGVWGGVSARGAS